MGFASETTDTVLLFPDELAESREESSRDVSPNSSIFVSVPELDEDAAELLDNEFSGPFLLLPP